MAHNFIPISTLKLLAHAKINLGLLVLEGRPDGYHDIETVFHRIDLSDEIELSPSSEINVIASDPAVPSYERNICYKAATLLRDRLGVHEGVTITIRKTIPVGAGLGGGSADAGAVLCELPRFWNRSIEDNALRRIALDLGSDVPYFLKSGSALARGRGEILEYFPLDIPFSILVCYPHIHISTAWAYRNIVPATRASHVALRTLLVDGLDKPVELGHRLHNDFEPLVFTAWPEIGEVKQEMVRGGAVYASLSGSGSAVYGFFSEKHLAENAGVGLQARKYFTSLTDPHFTPS